MGYSLKHSYSNGSTYFTEGGTPVNPPEWKSDKEQMELKGELDRLWNRIKLDETWHLKVDNLLTIAELGSKIFMAFDFSSPFNSAFKPPDRLLEFIMDCYRFMMTGDRRTPLLTYELLALDTSDYLSTQEREAYKAEQRSIMDTFYGDFSTNPVVASKIGIDYSIPDIYKYITMWCSHPNGIKDLVFSLRYICSYVEYL